MNHPNSIMNDARTFKPETTAIRLTILSVLAERAANNSRNKVNGPEVHQQLAYEHIATVLVECMDRLCPDHDERCPLPISMVEIDHLLFPSGLSMRLREQVVVNVSQLVKVLDTAFDLMAFQQSLHRPNRRISVSPAKTRALPPIPPPPTYSATVKLPHIQGTILRPSQALSHETRITPDIRRSASLFALETVANKQDPAPEPQQGPRILSLPQPPQPPPRTCSIVSSNNIILATNIHSRPNSTNPKPYPSPIPTSNSHAVTLPEPHVANHPPCSPIENEQTLPGSESTLIDQDTHQSNEKEDNSIDEDLRQWKISNDAKNPVYVTPILICVPIIVLAACVIFEGGILPLSHNPWVGPMPQSLVKWGARAVFCMRIDPTISDLSLCGPLKGAPNQYWRFITSAFISRGIIQVMFTSLLVGRFGSQTEKSIGHIRTAVVFFLGHVGSMLVTAIVSPITLETGSNGGGFALLASSFVDFMMHMPVSSHPVTDLMKWIVITILLLALGWLLPFVDNTVHVVGWSIGVVAALAIRPKLLLVRLKRQVLKSRISHPNNRNHRLPSDVLDSSMQANSASSVVVTLEFSKSRSTPFMRSCHQAADFGLRLISVAVLSGLFYMGFAVFYNIGGLGFGQPRSVIDCALCKFFNWSTWH